MLAEAGRAALAICPAPPELRADPAAVTERAGFVVAAATDALVEGAGAAPVTDGDDLRLRLGTYGDWLALRYPAHDGREAAELATVALSERLDGVDRLRCEALLVPGHVIEAAGDWREPIGPTHPLRVVEAARRLGASALDEDSLEGCQELLERLLEPAASVARAHDDPDPVRRVARAHPPAARRHGQVGRLPHGVRAHRTRLRQGQRALARARRRGAAARRPACWGRRSASASGTCSSTRAAAVRSGR